jgi:hypothetical protein
MHGFRTTLTNWADANTWDGRLLELQVGHLIPGKVKQSYHRAALVEERRPMMKAWGEYCSRPLAPEPAEADANVESFMRGRAKRRSRA